MFYRSNYRLIVRLGSVLALCFILTHPRPTLASELDPPPVANASLDANSRLVTILGGGKKSIDKTSIATEIDANRAKKIDSDRAIKVETTTKISPDGSLFVIYSRLVGDGTASREYRAIKINHDGRITRLSRPHKKGKKSSITPVSVDCNEKIGCFALDDRSFKCDSFGSYSIKNGLFKSIDIVGVDCIRHPEYASGDCSDLHSLVVTSGDDPMILIACKHSIYSIQLNQPGKGTAKKIYESELFIGDLSVINGGPVTTLLYKDEQQLSTKSRLVVQSNDSVQELGLPSTLERTSPYDYARDSQGKDIFASTGGIETCTNDECQFFPLFSRNQKSNAQPRHYRDGMVYDADNETLGNMENVLSNAALPWGVPLDSRLLGNDRLGFQKDGSFFFLQSADTIGPVKAMDHGILRGIVPTNWKDIPTAGFNHISTTQLTNKQLPIFTSSAGSAKILIKRAPTIYKTTDGKRVPIFDKESNLGRSPFSLSITSTPVIEGSSEITIPKTLPPGIYNFELTFQGTDNSIVKDYYRVFYDVPLSALSQKYISSLADDTSNVYGGDGTRPYTDCKSKSVCKLGSIDENGNVDADNYQISVQTEGIAIQPFGD